VEDSLLLTILYTLTFGIMLTLPVSGAAQQTSRQATFTLKPTPKTVAWGYYDAKAAPVLNSKPELGGLCPAKRAIL
jgi:hypothetical protein